MLGKLTGKTFGDAANPLLVSVRSGARASMPGHDGHRAQSRPQRPDRRGLAQVAATARFAYDSYRRFIQMYSNVVLDIEHTISRTSSTTFKDRKGYTLDTELTADDWVELIGEYKATIVERARASRFRRIRTSSSGARSARCSSPG